MENILRRLKALELEVSKLRGSPVGEITVWIPTVTQSAALTMSSVTAIYVPVGPLMYLSLYLVFSSAGTSGNAITVSGLPAAVRPSSSGSHFAIGSFAYSDAGTNSYAGTAVYTATDSIRFLPHATGNYLGIGPSFAVASGDALGVNCIYRWR